VRKLGVEIKVWKCTRLMSFRTTIHPSFINHIAPYRTVVTHTPHGQLLLAIYGHFAQTEREYISLRTKQGLAAARAQGKVLGRPMGSKNKHRVLDPFKLEILGYLKQGLSVASVMKLINPHLTQPVTYNTYRYYGFCCK